jgi:hypothetical protein
MLALSNGMIFVLNVKGISVFERSSDYCFSSRASLGEATGKRFWCWTSGESHATGSHSAIAKDNAYLCKNLFIETALIYACVCEGCKKRFVRSLIFSKTDMKAVAVDDSLKRRHPVYSPKGIPPRLIELPVDPDQLKVRVVSNILPFLPGLLNSNVSDLERLPDNKICRPYSTESFVCSQSGFDLPL